MTDQYRQEFAQHREEHSALALSLNELSELCSQEATAFIAPSHDAHAYDAPIVGAAALVNAGAPVEVTLYPDSLSRVCTKERLLRVCCRVSDEPETERWAPLRDVYFLESQAWLAVSLSAYAVEEEIDAQRDVMYALTDLQNKARHTGQEVSWTQARHKAFEGVMHLDPYELADEVSDQGLMPDVEDEVIERRVGTALRWVGPQVQECVDVQLSGARGCGDPRSVVEAECSAKYGPELAGLYIKHVEQVLLERAKGEGEE